MIKKAVTDHLGNKFESITEMCEYWGVPYDRFRNRVAHKWTVEMALTTPFSKRIRRVNTRPKSGASIEYNGVQYKSVRQLAIALGIDDRYLRYHLDRGMSVDNIIELRKRRDELAVDHTGQRFSSVYEMCNYWGIKEGTYQRKIKKGSTKEEALTQLRSKNRAIEYKGTTYKSLKELADAFGVNYGTLVGRLSCKKSLDEALQSRERIPNIKCTDMLGTTHNSVQKLSEAWGISVATTKVRLKKGFDIEVAVISSDIISLIHIGLDGKAYYKVQWFQDLVTARQIVGYYRPDLIKAYDKNNPTGKWNPIIKENQSNQEENKDGQSDI